LSWCRSISLRLYIFFGQVETGMFLYVGRCNTKVGTILPYGTQLNSYHTVFGNERDIMALAILARA
jgi:hypothetical protein